MSTLSNDYVILSVEGPVATVTMNRPDKANALSEAMMDALEDGLRAAVADPAVRVVVLAARGRIFCAGHDLAEMRSHEEAGYHEALFARCSRLMGTIRGLSRPVVAKVQGAAVAAGCQLVATCDLAYAVETAKFGVNGIDLGLFCSTPAVALSRSVLPKQALDLLLTGRLIAAPRAAEIGLINAAVPADGLDAAIADATTRIAAKIPEAMELGKDTFWSQLGLDLEDAYALAGNRMAENIGFDETKALIDGFVAGRKAH